MAAATQPKRRGPARHRHRRCAQQQVRLETVACCRDLQERGHTLEAIAELFALPARTLRNWSQRGRALCSAVVSLGRPSARAPLASRQQVLHLLADLGAGVGVPTLRQHFPDLARAELSDLVTRYRRVLQARWHESARRLCWQVPGRVWAIDFAQAPGWWESGRASAGPYLLAVRDLASGYQLSWLPAPAATAEGVCDVLAELFARHGLPLVLKADNGPPFRAERTKQFLTEAGVHFLFSPPYWPGYNGAIEAAIGSLKTRTEKQAARQGRAGYWSEADVLAALVEANVGQPRRLHGRMPAEVWDERTAISNVERACFELAVERHRYQVRTERGLAAEQQLDHWQGSALDRKAIERALVERDYLLFRGRRVPLTVKPGKVTFIM